MPDPLPLNMATIAIDATAKTATVSVTVAIPAVPVDGDAASLRMAQLEALGRARAALFDAIRAQGA